LTKRFISSIRPCSIREDTNVAGAQEAGHDDGVGSIRAPRKAFVAIEGGGHFAVFMKSSAFLGELVSRVRPLVKDQVTTR